MFIFRCCRGRAPPPAFSPDFDPDDDGVDEVVESMSQSNYDEHHHVGVPAEDARDSDYDKVVDLPIEQKKKHSIESKRNHMPDESENTYEDESRRTSVSMKLEDEEQKENLPNPINGDTEEEQNQLKSQMLKIEGKVNHKVVPFDLSHKMGFVISHNEESHLVHVIQISENGQAKEKGVEIGWIIDRVCGQSISEHEMHISDNKNFGNERTKIVQKIVLESTQKYRAAKSEYEDAKANYAKCDITEEELERLRWLPVDFLIPDEAEDDDLVESMKQRNARNSIFDHRLSKIPVQFRGEDEPVLRGICDLPQVAPTRLIKRNPGISGDKKKWVCLHKFALYYSTEKLDDDALDEFDAKLNKTGSREKLGKETAAIPLSDIIDARVAKLGNKLILNLSNRKIVTFKRMRGSQDDLFEWADTIIDHKAFYTSLLAYERARK
mmetsp:Transcript_12779/g.23216  ORF Transcript_12779/g.23216 Transcript_12779/m.23216 type:complete len:438 (-) Transcript_12779:224-1537(-)|eukprot:CAMPEP_0197531948 /NCGR_PEP_ID=MMETSP1318-20131121/37882_1 /TAXON_ID=552666 /ORGANISM="Partenskyella glossopodia, Strain RCC365" /LENGTH=437 /DNA_ID=CAMNT_0043088351 /DNA_START=98 /DNA_END=1411 /DNA_ORIENTATION=+